MAENFVPYENLQKLRDFEELPPQNLDRPGAGENPLDDQGVKDLTEVVNAFGPKLPPEMAATYLRELAIECPSNADVYEKSAMHEDMRALKRDLALQNQKKLAERQKAGEVLRQSRRSRLDQFYQAQGIMLQTDDPPDESQGRQIQGRQPEIQGRQIQGRQPTAHHACEWLAATLADGPRLQSELVTEAKAAGISQRSLERAKTALCVQSVRQGKPWVWSLPPNDHSTRADDAGEMETPPPGTIDSPCPTCGKPDRLFVKGSNIPGEPLQDMLICGACGHRETPAAGPA